jgi:hypothetical protein
MGRSMSPLILYGYLIAVDTSDVSHDKMLGQIVVASNREAKRLLVSWLIRFDHTDALISDRRESQTVLLGAKPKWRIVGESCGGRVDPGYRTSKRFPQRGRSALDFQISFAIAL